MKQYSKDMQLFRVETPVIDIIQFIPHLSDRPEPPPEYVRLKINLNFDPKTCTLEVLEQHRKKFGSEFSLSKFALFLVEIGEGSLVEVYLVPSDIVPTLKDLVQNKSLTFFLNLEILKLSVNEECLYPFSTPKHGLASGSLGSSSSQPTSTQTEIGSQTSISEQTTSSAGAGAESSKGNCGPLTLVDCSEKIIAGLSSELKPMAVTLHGRGFISTELLREITELPATKMDNASKLYVAILRSVQHHPHRYSEFISILRSNTLLYSDLLKVLEETYQEKEKNAENQLTVPTLDLNQPADNALSLVPSSTRSAGNSLAKQVEWFESRFHDLRKSALTEVKDIPVARFRQTLMTLPIAISKEHETFIVDKYSVFMQAESVEYIFAHLNLYLSFIDFSLLEHIIEHFGSHGLQQKMEQYSRDMEIIPHLSGRPEAPPEYVRLKMKLNFDPNTCTLEDLEQHRKRLGGEFSLSKFALFLVEIGEGSLVEVYLVPSDIVSSLKDLVQKKTFTLFRELKILELYVNKLRNVSTLLFFMYLLRGVLRL